MDTGRLLCQVVAHSNQHLLHPKFLQQSSYGEFVSHQEQD